MGLLDEAKGALQNPILSHAMQLVNNPQTGGLQGLIQSFHDKGLGSIVQSWVGTGTNQPISADQITHALGSDRIQQIAQASGLNVQAVASHLSALLPGIIDKLTPQGAVPAAASTPTR